MEAVDVHLDDFKEAMEKVLAEQKSLERRMLDALHARPRRRRGPRRAALVVAPRRRARRRCPARPAQRDTPQTPWAGATSGPLDGSAFAGFGATGAHMQLPHLTPKTPHGKAMPTSSCASSTCPRSRGPRR